MGTVHAPLQEALAKMLDAIDATLRSGGYQGVPVVMTLAGGLAVHFYVGSRFTEDVDADNQTQCTVWVDEAQAAPHLHVSDESRKFSRRVLLPVKDLVFEYVDADGRPSMLHLDGQYNSSFSLMHEDCAEDSVEWAGIGNERRLVQLRVLSPVDLALSKVARFAGNDQEDILALAEAGLFTSKQLLSRAHEALAYYVGNTSMVRQSVQLICERIDDQARRRTMAQR